MSDIDRAKQAVRDRVRRRLIDGGGAPEDSYGEIPGFYGNERTAERLAGLVVWRRARTVKANPDWAQLLVCARCISRRRPRGLVWRELTAEKIAAIPTPAARHAARGRA